MVNLCDVLRVRFSATLGERLDIKVVLIKLLPARALLFEMSGKPFLGRPHPLRHKSVE
jgi:hypothetical protein